MIQREMDAPNEMLGGNGKTADYEWIKKAAEEWAEKELEKMKDNQLIEVAKKSLQDDLVYGESMIHVDENGKPTHIPVGSKEYWEAKDRQSLWKPVPNMSQGLYEKMTNSTELPDMSGYHQYTASVDPINTTGGLSDIRIYKTHKDGRVEDVTPAGSVYESLESILQDIYNINPVKLWESVVNIQEKLNRTIQSGAYIQKDGTK